jgi:hypothetical protein
VSRRPRRERESRLELRQARLSRLSKGCRWLDLTHGDVWEVTHVYAKAAKFVCLRTGIRMTAFESERLALAKGWRPLRGREFQRSFEITQGTAPFELVRGRLPSAKVLRELPPAGSGIVPKPARPESVGALIRGSR